MPKIFSRFRLTLPIIDDRVENMNTIVLKPSPSASKWTKERLKRHTGSFTEEKRSSVPHGGKDCILVQCVADKWLGWFPISEVIIIKE
jgi:hypothetical protein